MHHKLPYCGWSINKTHWICESDNSDRQTCSAFSGKKINTHCDTRLFFNSKKYERQVTQQLVANIEYTELYNSDRRLLNISIHSTHQSKIFESSGDQNTLQHVLHI